MRVTSICGVVALAALVTAQNTTLQVVKLSIDGRFDNPLDLANTRPTIAWQILQTVDCDLPICPGDRQTAYEVQVATSAFNLAAGQLQWGSGKVDDRAQQVRYDGNVSSRESRSWRVRVWDAHGQPSAWSNVSTWATGLLEQADWGQARWIEYPDRNEKQPLPIFARQFSIPEGKEVVTARLYLSGVGMHYATVNGEAITDEVLAPGYSNYQLSSEYRTYNIKHVLRSGENVLGVRLGNGPAYIRRSVTNLAVGRNSPYAWWESQLKGNGTLVGDVQVGSSSVRLSSVTGYHLVGSVNIDTGDGGERLESRVINNIDNTTNTISFAPGLELAHASGGRVTGSGNNVAAEDPSAGAAVTPRLITRLEISYNDGSTDTIVTDRSWRTALGPLVTDSWYSGSDYDARREQANWDRPGAPANSSWIAAGIAPPPNLATKLVARAAEPIKIVERFVPVSITNPINGTWVFDLGQNIAGMPLLKLPQMPAGVVIKMAPAESLNANGTVNQASIGFAGRGADIFNTYTTAGRAGGETWHPDFNYFAMQWIQVTGLPAGFTPGPDLITGLRVQGDVPVAGTFTSSNARLNRIHKMARYSFYSNIMSVFTDCPGREKLSYPADYTMPMGAIYRNVHLDAFLRTTMRHLVEAQSIANTSMAGNVALKAPVYDGGYTGRFGDEINWGNAIVLVPSLLYDLYGDTSVMETYYEQMTKFVTYIQREKAQNHIVDAALADWVEAVPFESREITSGRITGTWGYYLTITAMARMANLTSHAADAIHYANLAVQIRNAFNGAFFNNATRRYTNLGNAAKSNATQTAQALALDAGLVPEQHRKSVLNALVSATFYFSPRGSPHLSGGTLGMGPIVRALSAGGHDDVLWAALQRNDRPSYGYMLRPTVANPGGLTTLPERWDLGASQNHMILAQIDEWFHAGVAGIKTGALSAMSSTWGPGLVFEPKPVGDLEWSGGTYGSRWGEVGTRWTRSREGVFELRVWVPGNVGAEVRLPAGGGVVASVRAAFVSGGNGTVGAVYKVPSGEHKFSVKLAVVNSTLGLVDER
ncbi:putative secreted protein [Ophiobolus disseminans]|uniref:alpha-L-rhamnosidase n=1 Tax=Ophiobolus disseminans TaxID=1469910 RepID=A0A6A6ZN79_9PLEO|nr:putative secreted protein [Ophiobolus disseminans]